MFKYNKTCSLICLSVYLLVSTNCAPWLIYKSSEVLFGVIYDDYACKDKNCGCDSAFKCLINCCCEKTINTMSCCSSDEPANSESESCCSEAENCCSERESCSCSEEEFPARFPVVKSSGCSTDLSENLAEGRNSHVFLIYNRIREKLFNKPSHWFPYSDSHSFEYYSKISKVPIS